MQENTNQNVMDKLTKVCTCKAISRAKIKEAIKNGALTLEEVQRITGAGNGACGGKRCTPKILELLEAFKK